MKTYNIYVNRNDLSTNSRNINDHLYETIIFDNIQNEQKIKKLLKQSLNKFFERLNIKYGSHILIVGIGNREHTADSVGPRTINHIKVNSYFENIGIKKNGTIVSSIIPSVFEKTGIITTKIIKSICKDIKPDFVILIDSMITNNIDLLNKSIEINDKGIISAGGIFKNQSEISKETLDINVLAIGVTTAIETSFNKSSLEYFLSTKNVDNYVIEISRIIGEVLNEIIYDL